jgi:hypothetical protein
MNHFDLMTEIAFVDIIDHEFILCVSQSSAALPTPLKPHFICVESLRAPGISIMTSERHESFMQID